MLKKSKRLRSAEVDLVLAKGRSARSAHLQVKLVAAPHSLHSAAIAPKSLARKAVVRNSLRRALYRALAATDTSALTGTAVFFVRAIPAGKRPAAVFAAELPPLLRDLVSKLK